MQTISIKTLSKAMLAKHHYASAKYFKLIKLIDTLV